LRRHVSDGSESPQLPPTDYESLNKGDNEQAATSNMSSPFGRDPFSAQSPSKKAGLSSTPMCPPPPPPPLPQTLPRIKEVAPDHSDFSETESNGLVSNLWADQSLVRSCDALLQWMERTNVGLCDNTRCLWPSWQTLESTLSVLEIQKLNQRQQSHTEQNLRFGFFRII